VNVNSCHPVGHRFPSRRGSGRKRAHRNHTPSRATNPVPRMDGATQIGPKHATQAKPGNGLNSSRVASAFAVPACSIVATPVQTDFHPYRWVKDPCITRKLAHGHMCVKAPGRQCAVEAFFPHTHCRSLFRPREINPDLIVTRPQIYGLTSNCQGQCEEKQKGRICFWF
jgi:hypothetical protein